MAQHGRVRGWRSPLRLLQLSDKAGGGDFTAEDAERPGELGAFAGAALDPFRAANCAG
jgi:hypothetical protein